ncbi:MAG: hypothetical protein PHE29_04530 [Tissierellia bacterium]|nr:hypothetical protein [Tissierellia bacterium]
MLSQSPNAGFIKTNLFLRPLSCSLDKQNVISCRIDLIFTSEILYPIKIIGCSTNNVKSLADKYLSFAVKQAHGAWETSEKLYFLSNYHLHQARKGWHFNVYLLANL